MKILFSVKIFDTEFSTWFIYFEVLSPKKSFWKLICANVCVYVLEVCTDQIFQSRSEREIEISIQARPGPKRNTEFWPGYGPANFFSDFVPDCLGLSDFKTDLFVCLHMINVFFTDDLFFCNSLKLPILTAFCYIS